MLSANRSLNRILLLLSFCAFLNYIDRSNLSLAAPMLKDELGLSPSQLGILLSAFFWTYTVAPVFAGWLVDRFEVKWILAAGLFLWSASTAFIFFLHAFFALLAARIVLGIGESVAYPSYSKIISSHFPESRRGVANSAVSIGQSVGPMVGLLAGAPLIQFLGWRYFFLTLGLAGMLWLLPWAAWMPPTPSQSQSIQKQTILAILKQRSARGTCLTLFCMNYYSYFMLTWLPFYLVRERYFSLNKMSVVGAGMFFFCAVAAWVFAKLSDSRITSGAAPSTVRKNVMVVSTAATGLFVVAAAFSPDSLSILFLLLAGAAFGATSSSTWAITQRLSGASVVGRWVGVQLFFGNLAGVVAPAVTGFIVQQTGHFYSAFLIVAAVSWLGTLGWLFAIGPIEPVIWPQNSSTQL